VIAEKGALGGPVLIGFKRVIYDLPRM